MRRLLSRPKLSTVAGLCCFVFFVSGFRSIYFSNEDEIVEIDDDSIDVDVDQEVDQMFEPPVDPNGRKMEALNVSRLDALLNYSVILYPNISNQTPWKAPILWEGMFDGEIYDKAHIVANSSVALTVFAVGRYLEAYLKPFILSAEQHFMVGLPVTYYIFTDLPEEVPEFELGPRRTMKVLLSQRYSRWEDISMMRMKTISKMIESEISFQCSYVYCLDVDSVFQARFGSEILSDSVALLHSWFYNLPKDRYSYDKNPKSQAFMKTGDYYYHAAVFGGTWRNVKALVDFCYQGIIEDKKNEVEALWHDESHLNKYFWLNKPTKVLSPEYYWDELSFGSRPEIKVQRMVWAEKRYDVLRMKKKNYRLHH